MCLACVARPANGPGHTPAAQAILIAWTDADQRQAQIVYRQLPRWSRKLFDALSAFPTRSHGQTELGALVASPDAPFDLEDACKWAAEYCAAVGRGMPVARAVGADGEPSYRMQEAAARLFAELARVQA